MSKQGETIGAQASMPRDRDYKLLWRHQNQEEDGEQRPKSINIR